MNDTPLIAAAKGREMTETGIPGSSDNLSGGAHGAEGQLDHKPLVGTAQPEQVATFMRKEPLAAALIALIIGYMLGKIT